MGNTSNFTVFSSGNPLGSKLEKKKKKEVEDINIILKPISVKRLQACELKLRYK
jgi:hypothetical protein